MIQTPRCVTPGIQRLVIGWMLAMTVTVQAEETTITAESVLIRLIDNVDVPAGTAGVLSTVTAVEGQAVGKGERIAQIDDAEPQLALARAEIELELTKMQVDNDISVRLAHAAADFALAAYQRLKTAATSLPGSVSQAELEELKHAAMQARLTLEDAKRELQLVQATQRLKENDLRTKARHVEVCQINAPLEGTVAQVFREQGEWVEPGRESVADYQCTPIASRGFRECVGGPARSQGCDRPIDCRATGRCAESVRRTRRLRPSANRSRQRLRACVGRD